MPGGRAGKNKGGHADFRTVRGGGHEEIGVQEGGAV